jgi:hypothetical protein
MNTTGRGLWVSFVPSQNEPQGLLLSAALGQLLLHVKLNDLIALRLIPANQYLDTKGISTLNDSCEK